MGMHPHRNPNLSFDGIGRSSIEAFDHEILFDPFEERET
jgi:hypothetical protein